MCGQVGIIFGKKRRRIVEREYLNEVFIRMLLCSEERGPHASGMAWLRTDGEYRLFKRPIRAHRLVVEPTFAELMTEVDNQTTILMGHTRWRTRGSETNSRNNHPIRAGNIIGTQQRHHLQCRSIILPIPTAALCRGRQRSYFPTRRLFHLRPWI